MFEVSLRIVSSIGGFAKGADSAFNGLTKCEEARCFVALCSPLMQNSLAWKVWICLNYSILRAGFIKRSKPVFTQINIEYLKNRHYQSKDSD